MMTLHFYQDILCAVADEKMDEIIGLFYDTILTSRVASGFIGMQAVKSLLKSKVLSSEDQSILSLSLRIGEFLLQYVIVIEYAAFLWNFHTASCFMLSLYRVGCNYLSDPKLSLLKFGDGWVIWSPLCDWCNYWESWE